MLARRIASVAMDVDRPPPCFVFLFFVELERALHTQCYIMVTLWCYDLLRYTYDS